MIIRQNQLKCDGVITKTACQVTVIAGRKFTSGNILITNTEAATTGCPEDIVVTGGHQCIQVGRINNRACQYRFSLVNQLDIT